MPKIQTYGGPTVAPVQTTRARFRAADNNGGVGAAVARGLQQAGGAVADYAVAQDQMEDALAKTTADNLYLGVANTANTALSQYRTSAGQDALGVRPSVEKTLDDTVNGALAKVDPRTRRYLEPQLAKLRADAGNVVASHAIAQLKVFEQKTGEAKFSNLIESAVIADDPAKRSEYITQAKEQAKANAVGMGLGGDDILAKVARDAASAAHTAVVRRYISDKDYDLADAYFKANAGDMSAGDEASISSDLAGPMQKRWASKTVDALMALPPITGEPGKGGAASPVADGGSAIKGLFPQAAITSTYRGPDHPLSKKRPSSWHTQSHAAVDVKPIAGMSFEQYVKEVEGAGYTVLEAINEVGKGRTRDATGDHWHIVLGKGGGGTVPAARRWDMQDVTQRIFAAAEREGWSIEQRDAALSEAKERVSLDETLKARQEADADRAASEWVLSRGDGFTDLSQMPPSVRAGLSPDALRQYQGVAKSNAKPKEPVANGNASTSLELMRVLEPERFAKEPLGKYVGQMTRAELQGLAVEQAKMLKGDPDKSVRSKVASTISTFGVDDGLTGNTDKVRQKRVAVQKIMEGELRAVTGGKRNPTDDELYRAYQSATRDVTFKTTTFWGGTGEKTKPRFELGADDVPPDRRGKIIKGYRDTYGSDPTEEQVAEIYRNGKGRFW